MKLRLDSDCPGDYLRQTDIIDFEQPNVANLAKRFKTESVSETDLIRLAYEFVRDEIFHSADIVGKHVTCKASEVLAAGEGICFAKSHLLAALLRANAVPAGFCYQRLRLNDDRNSPFVLHGLNAVYVREIDRWVRLDARGNKSGVDARFSVDEERLAFSIRPLSGESDYPVLHADPVNEVVETLKRRKTFEELWSNLPDRILGRNENYRKEDKI